MSDHDSDPGSPAGDSLDDALREAFDGESVVEAISRDYGVRPRVLLRDAEDGAGPVVNPRSTVELDDPRYRTLGEIARGGVGIIFKGLDADLGREVAIKVLQDRHTGHETIAERFLEEAQIGGQLQHPGIVPVYGLSTDRAGQPFFAMKLVRGKTLGALLAERSSPLEHRRRMLDIFLRLCRTVAYAHARGVIHRDLKPANVMIGGYGEAQLMDWGFAKVLDREPEERLPGATIVTTLRSDGEGSQSIAGSVMGTPAYMPPEQAMGQIDALDERCDVFALGAILCEILTGAPPYVGEPTDLLLMAAQARLDDARERLSKCGVDDELVALANDCLAPVRGERPDDALRVAQRLEEHLAAVEERARRHELDEAEARSRQREEQARVAEVTLARTRAEQAAAERKREAERVRTRAAQEKRRAATAQQARQTALVAAALLLAALVLGGGGAIWHAAETRREERVRTEQAQAVFAQAVGLTERGEFGRGASAAREAMRLLDADDGAHDRAAALLVTCETGIARRDDLERRTRRYRALLGDLRQALWSGDGGAAVERLMREKGGAFDGPDVDAAAADVPPGLRRELAGRMDLWLAVRVSDWRPRDLLRDAIAAYANALDPDPARRELRFAVASGARPRVLKMARSWPVATAPPETTALLVHSLNTGFGNVEEARRLLEAARVLESTTPSLLSVGASVYMSLDPPDLHKAMGLVRRLVSLVRDQAGGWGRLAYVAGSIGDVAAAEAAAEVCRELAPKSPLPLHRLYRAHRRIGSRARAAEIAAELRRRFRKDVWGYLWAADLTYETGNAAKAFRWAEAARRADPEDPYPLLYIANYCRAAGRYEAAVPLLVEFCKRNPDHTSGATSLALAYVALGQPEKAQAAMDRVMQNGTPGAAMLAFQANVHARLELWPAAAAAARKSLDLDPENVSARVVLAQCHFAADEHDAALRELARANAIRPFAETYFWAGLFHMRRGEYARARLAFGEAVRLRSFAAAPFAAHAAYLAGDLDVALRDTFLAVDARRLDPLPHVVRALIRVRDGDFDQAEASLRKARDLSGGRSYPAFAIAELELARGRLSVAHEHLGRTLEAGPIQYYGTIVDFVGAGRPHYQWLHTVTAPAAHEELAGAVRAYYADDYEKAVALFENAGFESPSVWYLLATACAGAALGEKGSAYAQKLVVHCSAALARDNLRDQAEARWWLWRLRSDRRLPSPRNDEGGVWKPIRADIAKLLRISEGPK